MKPDEFIAQLVPAARASMAHTKVPASFTIAQAALESSWGASQLALKGFNLFGVKADKAWTGETLTMNTQEFIKGKWVMVAAKWRRYPGWLECLDDHAAFLIKNPRYKPAFACVGAEAFAKAIAAAGYATDPLYAQKVISVIRSHNLTQYDSLEK